MTFIRSLFGQGEKRAVSFQQVFGSGSTFASTKTSAGTKVTEESSLQLTTVYACTSLISEVVGTLPWDVVDTRGQVRRPVQGPYWMQRPNVDQQPTDFKQRVTTSLLLWGNAFLFQTRDAVGRTLELWPLHPGDVRWDPDRKGWLFKGEPTRPGEIVHIPGFGVPGQRLGLSPIGAAREAVGLGLAAEEFGARFFGSGANPGGVLSTDQTLTKEQATAIKKNFQASSAGIGKAHDPAVLAGGLQWTPVSVPPEDAQFLETRRFQRSEICGLFRVPPHLIGDVSGSTSWGTGIEQQNIGFVTYTLGPWLNRLEEAFSSLMPSGRQVKFNVNALLRGDAQSRSEFYRTMREIGGMNADEVREKEDMPPIPGGAGQTFMQPLNHGPLGSDPLDDPDVTDEDPA